MYTAFQQSLRHFYGYSNQALQFHQYEFTFTVLDTKLRALKLLIKMSYHLKAGLKNTCHKEDQSRLKGNGAPLPFDCLPIDWSLETA